jgi:hypothetical protein
MAINVAAFPEHFPREAIVAIFEAGAQDGRRGRRCRRRRPHDPQPRADLRARRAGGRPPRPGVPQGSGARPGDVLVLSKPLGTGLALAAGTEADKAAAIAGMKTLNRGASETLQALGDASTPSPTSPATGSPATAGRWPSAATSASSSTHAGSSPIRVRSRPPTPVKRTGGDPRNRDYLAGHLDSTARPGPRRSASTRRRRAACSPPSTPAADAVSPPGWWRVGTVEAGARRSSSCAVATRARGVAAKAPPPARSSRSSGRRVRDRRRHRRGRPRRVGRSARRRCRDPASRHAGARRPRLQAADEKDRERLFDRIAGGASPGRSAASARRSATSSAWPTRSGSRVAGDRRARRRARRRGQRRHLGLRVAVRPPCRDAGEGRPALPERRRREHPRQGRARPRDARLAEHYPHWSFDTNKGYPCPVHKAALQGYGPSAIHRRTWIFMDHYVPWTGTLFRVF